MAAATGSHKVALCYVQQVIESGNYTLQQLLREDLGQESSVTRARLTRSFFSHAIELQHVVVEQAATDWPPDSVHFCLAVDRALPLILRLLSTSSAPLCCSVRTPP